MFVFLANNSQEHGVCWASGCLRFWLGEPVYQGQETGYQLQLMIVQFFLHQERWSACRQEMKPLAGWSNDNNLSLNLNKAQRDDCREDPSFLVRQDVWVCTLTKSRLKYAQKILKLFFVVGAFRWTGLTSPAAETGVETSRHFIPLLYFYSPFYFLQASYTLWWGIKMQHRSEEAGDSQCFSGFVLEILTLWSFVKENKATCLHLDRRSSSSMNTNRSKKLDEEKVNS